MTKKMSYTLWTVQGLLALLFLFAGGVKLALPVEMLTKQMPLPGWFVRFIGVAEVLGALGLVLPGLLRVKRGLTPLAAAGLAIVMAGATVLSVVWVGAAAALAPLTVGLLTVFVVYGHTATRPDSFRVERAIIVQSPPEKIFGLIDDFHQWGSWSPWEKLDPAMKKTYSGAARGPGAVYAWAGNSKAGEGRMEIVETVPYSRTAIKLDFLKPFVAHNTAEFTLDAEGGSTRVTWAMYGPQSYMLKVMSMFFSMDSMVGKDFEEGLAKMKAIAESRTVYSNQPGVHTCK
jgi:hypothetical protein